MVTGGFREKTPKIWGSFEQNFVYDHFQKPQWDAHSVFRNMIFTAWKDRNFIYGIKASYKLHSAMLLFRADGMPMSRQRLHSPLKLDLYDKTTYKYTKDKNLVWNQYTLFDSSRFIYSDCRSSPVKMYMPTSEHCWKKNRGAQWVRTSNLWITGLTCYQLSYIRKYVEWDFNFYCTVLYIATLYNVTPHCVMHA